MLIKDYEWIGLNCGDILISNPFTRTLKAMTLMYKRF